MTRLTMTSCLKLAPIKILKDKKNFIVEDKASGEFYEMTEVCIDAIGMMSDGALLGEIESQLKQKYPQEDVNLIDFAGQLLEIGLIEEIDGVRLDIKKESRQPLGFQWVSPMAGQFFFNKIAMNLYLFLFMGNLALFLFNPDLFPHYRDLFIFHLMVLNIPAWMVLTFVLILIHEFGHVFAIRACNLPAKLEVGHRLFLVVLETDMSAAWKLPSKERNRLYLAGLCFDNAILFLALVLQVLIPNGAGIFQGVLRLIVLDTVIRMAYQLCVYLKTDLYYVFENSSGCYNLMENAQQLLRQRFKLLQKTPAHEEVVFESERKTVYWYSIFYFIGVVVMAALYIFIYLPQLFYAIQKILPGFEKPVASISFWDSAVFVLQLLFAVLLLGYSWTKKYRRKA